MPSLSGTLPDQPGPEVSCRWCGSPTDLTFAPEGSRVGPVPLHMLCGANFIRAYNRLRAGMTLSDRDMGRVRLLTEGHAAASAGDPIVTSILQDLQ